MDLPETLTKKKQKTPKHSESRKCLLCLVSVSQEDSVSESSSDAGLGSEPDSETTTIGKK